MDHCAHIQADTVVSIAIGSIIEPRFFGREIGLSTLVVFFSLVFWGYTLGPVGMLFSVPLTMIVKIALEGSQETRWLAIFLGPDRIDIALSSGKTVDASSVMLPPLENSTEDSLRR